MVLPNHGFARTVGSHQDQVAGFVKEVRRESAIDNIAPNAGRPRPVEVGHRFEAFYPAQAQAPLKASAGAV
jgi:hypothetical protein